MKNNTVRKVKNAFNRFTRWLKPAKQKITEYGDRLKEIK